MINYVLHDPMFGYLVGISLFACFAYFIFAAIFESVERQKVIECAEDWAARRQRRNQREESAALWDSVNQLKKGQMTQGLDDRLPAYKRKTPKELK